QLLGVMLLAEPLQALPVLEFHANRKPPTKKRSTSGRFIEAQRLKVIYIDGAAPLIEALRVEAAALQASISLTTDLLRRWHAQRPASAGPASSLRYLSGHLPTLRGRRGSVYMLLLTNKLWSGSKMKFMMLLWYLTLQKTVDRHGRRV
ncbi:MAG TPA: hypothetical protein VIM62_02275, partial [Acidobacteriaceae bacterium]